MIGVISDMHRNADPVQLFLMNCHGCFFLNHDESFTSFNAGSILAHDIISR